MPFEVRLCRTKEGFVCIFHPLAASPRAILQVFKPLGRQSSISSPVSDTNPGRHAPAAARGLILRDHCLNSAAASFIVGSGNQRFEGYSIKHSCFAIERTVY